MTRRIFGLPKSYLEMIKVSGSTALFLFNFDTRQMHGVFAADGKAGLNLEPAAFGGFRRKGPEGSSPFPAQQRFRVHAERAPLPERVWAHIPNRKEGAAAAAWTTSCGSMRGRRWRCSSSSAPRRAAAPLTTTPRWRRRWSPSAS